MSNIDIAEISTIQNRSKQLRHNGARVFGSLWNRWKYILCQLTSLTGQQLTASEADIYIWQVVTN